MNSSMPAGHHHQPAAEHRAHAEAADELAGARGDEHDRQRHRQEDQAGVQRREARAPAAGRASSRTTSGTARR